jgi:phosphoenolpyruvate-protein kinase (PTS system EI component)
LTSKVVWLTNLAGAFASSFSQLPRVCFTKIIAKKLKIDHVTIRQTISWHTTSTQAIYIAGKEHQLQFKAIAQESQEWLHCQLIQMAPKL